MSDQIAPVLADKDLAPLVTFDLVPYGNAHTTDGKTTCQHGPTECLGNTIEACALDMMDYSNALGFVVAFEQVLSENPDPEAATKAVFAKQSFGISEADLTACSTGPQGAKLTAKAAADTDANHKYTPWVDVNGEHNSAAEQNLKKAICAALGASAPASCSSFGPDSLITPSYASLAQMVI